MTSPFKGKFKVTSPRGYRILFGKKEYHKGLDLVGTDDKNVYAVADGTVNTLFEKNGFGNYVRQTLADGRRIYYGHLASFAVKSGEKVKKGQLLGVMGATGRVTGAHTHLELRPSGSSSESLDISAFTGIPNTVGTYEGAFETEDFNTEDNNMNSERFKELWLEMRKELQDNDANEYSKEARDWAIKTGLIKGGTTLINGEPNYMFEDIVTREQLITVLYRFAQMIGKI